MVEDKKISESAELLLKGAKMLKYHCPDCSMPLFKYNEKIICPSCKTEFQIQDEKLVKIEETKESNVRFERVERSESKVGKSIQKYLEEIVKKLCVRALKSESLNEIKEIVNIIKDLVDILEKIR